MAVFHNAMREWGVYTRKHPRRVISADCENYPTLRWLFEYAVNLRAHKHLAKRFTVEGVQYAIVYIGWRMCVMHVRTGRVLVGAAGGRHE